MQGRKPAGEHAPVRRGASGGHRNPPAAAGVRKRLKRGDGTVPKRCMVRMVQGLEGAWRSKPVWPRVSGRKNGAAFRSSATLAAAR